jgi:hypothetical protein
MKSVKNLLFALVMFLGGHTAAVAIAPAPYLIVPPGLNPTNAELTVPGMPLNWPQGVLTKQWGKGGKCGIDCAGFEGAALAPGSFLDFTNLRFADPADPKAVKITQIVWTCGKNPDDSGIVCSGPQSIYDPKTPDDPIEHMPTPGSPVYVVAVTEPASWALLIAGFGMVGGALRQRSRLVTA